jgi:hypothetical protein
MDDRPMTAAASYVRMAMGICMYDTCILLLCDRPMTAAHGDGSLYRAALEPLPPLLQTNTSMYTYTLSPDSTYKYI